jgi:hypothetical protein
VCTAPGLLLDAMVAVGYSENSDPEALAKNREKGCWPELEVYKSVIAERSGLTGNDLAAWQRRFDTRSDNFQLTSLITLGGTEFALYSRLSRVTQGQQGKVKFRVVQRSFNPD